MPEQLERLRSVLGDRYALERELVAGGMATVYLAEDLKHQRKVALKVLRPDLAMTLGPERFLREVTIAAKLLALLGRRDEAVNLLREALNNGARLNADEALFHWWAPIKDYPPFLELVKLRDGS